MEKPPYVHRDVIRVFTGVQSPVDFADCILGKEREELLKEVAPIVGSAQRAIPRDAGPVFTTTTVSAGQVVMVWTGSVAARVGCRACPGRLGGGLRSGGNDHWVTAWGPAAMIWAAPLAPGRERSGPGGVRSPPPAPSAGRLRGRPMRGRTGRTLTLRARFEAATKLR